MFSYVVKRLDYVCTTIIAFYQRAISYSHKLTKKQITLMRCEILAIFLFIIQDNLVRDGLSVDNSFLSEGMAFFKDSDLSEFIKDRFRGYNAIKLNRYSPQALWSNVNNNKDVGGVASKCLTLFSNYVYYIINGIEDACFSNELPKCSFTYSQNIFNCMINVIPRMANQIGETYSEVIKALKEENNAKMMLGNPAGDNMNNNYDDLPYLDELEDKDITVGYYNREINRLRGELAELKAMRNRGELQTFEYKMLLNSLFDYMHELRAKVKNASVAGLIEITIKPLLLKLMIAVGVAMLILLFVFQLEFFSIALSVMKIVSPILMAICLFLLLPLTLFRRTRRFGAASLYISSYCWAIILWTFSAINVYFTCELWLFILGLLVAGFGVVPISLISSVISGHWMMVLDIAIWTILLFLTRGIAIHFSKKSENKD